MCARMYVDGCQFHNKDQKSWLVSIVVTLASSPSPAACSLLHLSGGERSHVCVLIRDPGHACVRCNSSCQFYPQSKIPSWKACQFMPPPRHQPFTASSIPHAHNAIRNLIERRKFFPPLTFFCELLYIFFSFPLSLRGVHAVRNPLSPSSTPPIKPTQKGV